MIPSGPRMTEEFLLKLFQDGHWTVIGLSVARVPAFHNVFPELRNSLVQRLAKVRIGPDKFCRRLEGEPGKVVEHQHLAVAIGTCADADGRDAKPACDHS